MKKVIISGIVGLALVALTACGQKVVEVKPELKCNMGSKCDMGKASSKVSNVAK